MGIAKVYSKCVALAATGYANSSQNNLTSSIQPWVRERLKCCFGWMLLDATRGAISTYHLNMMAID